MATLFPLPEPGPQGWSINRLAVELDLDRRTIERRLRDAGVAAIGERAGDAVYSLASAARACFAAPSATGMAELARRKLAAQAEAAELDVKAKRADLVPAEAVRQAARARATVEREAWSNWPAQAGPILATEFNVDIVRFTAALERTVRDHMEARADAAATDGGTDLQPGLGEGLPAGTAADGFELV